MEEEMKGFWKFFAILIAAAAINLAGGIIGKTLLGYILFFVGLAALIAVFVYLFKKSSYFKDGRHKVLILGLFMAALLASALILVLGSSTARFTSARSSGSLLSGVTGSARSYSGGFSGGFSGGGGNFTRNGNDGSFSGGNFSGGNGFSSRNGSSTSGSSTGSTTSSAYSAAASAIMVRMVIERVLGWLFLVAGAILLLVFVLRLVTKKVTYTGARLKVLILGLLVGAMLASSTTLLVTRQTRRFSGNFNRSQAGLTSGTQSAGQPGAPNGTFVPAATTAAPTETPTPTLNPTDIAATATAMAPQPTDTPTPVVVSDLVVCLDYNRQVGETIYTSPSLNGTTVGVVPAAACFTVDGRNSQYPGWYHLEKGQNGLGGITFSTDENTHQLWVNGTHFMSTAVSLDELPELAVTTK
jgi:Uncharacterized protein conserved in bacteria